MGLLKFLLDLPYNILYIIWEAIGYFIVFLLALFKAIIWLLNPIIGEVNWQTPKWYPKALVLNKIFITKTLKYKTYIGSIIILSFIAYFSGNYLYHWYLNRPKPIEPAPIVIRNFSASFYRPYYSSSALEIVFSGNKRSPAPLELIGKKIEEGITIKPEITGTWRWYSDNRIYFEPENNWPLSEKYTVTIDDKKLFAQYNTLKEDDKTFSFITEDFSYSIEKQEFYQNPLKPSEKFGIFTIQFSHPVDKTKFEKAISLGIYALPTKEDPEHFIKSVNFTVNYSNNKAFIKSKPIEMLDDESELKLTIEKGIASTLGGHETDSYKTAYVTIPSKNGLYIKSADVNLLEVNNNQMRQTLTLKFSHEVNAKDLAKVIKVWQLPIVKDRNNDEKTFKEEYYDELAKKYRFKIDITENEFAQSKVLPLTIIEGERDYENVINFEFKGEQEHYIYITIDQPLISNGGYHLYKKYEDVIKIPKYSKILKFAANGAILSLSGEKKLPIVSRNMKNVELEIKRVIPSQLQHLVSFSYNRDFDWRGFGNLDSDHFVEHYSTRKNIEGSPEEIKYTDLDLSDFIRKDVKEDTNRGVFLVSLYGKGKDENYSEYYASKFIMITDLGIINKTSLDQSQDIFVQSIKTGQPIANAKVSVMGLNGIEIISQQTDENGHVHFDSFSDYYKGIKPLLYVVQKDQDLSFLPIRNWSQQLNLSRFDIGGIHETTDGGELRSHIFSDRGIYRPGDTFNIGMIIRAQDWAKSLEGVRLEAVVYDAKSNKVLEKEFKLDKLGFEELSYKTDYTSPTGEWSINLYLKNSYNSYRTLLGSTSIVLREFEPDKTTVKLALLPEIKDGWVDPDQLYGKVQANNLFGTPAQDRRVSSQLILQPSVPYFSKYSDYSFYQNIKRYRDSFNIEVEDNYTDENGEATINLPIENFEGNYTAKLLVDVFEPDSGRSVAATASVFVSPDQYLVGAKPDGRMDYIKRDTTRLVNLIAINPQLERIDLNDLTLIISEQKYLSSLVKQDSGVYKYESRPKEVILTQLPYVINKENTVYTIDTSKPGNFKLSLQNKNGETVYQTAYSIAGTANITRNLDRNAELDIKIDQHHYKPGDEIEVSIIAPYIGSGIITIERDKVYSWKWFKTDTNSTVQKITVPEGIDGNAYINVQFMRDPSSDEIFMSPLSYGVIPFKISTEKFDDHIKLTVPEKIKPGDTLPITIKTNSKQRVAIFAVDEGILQVSGYKLKNPLNDFIRKRALSVSTAQIIDLILPEYSRLLNSSAPGGDDDIYENPETSGHLNPFKRKVDEPVAFWSGLIDVDTTETINYTVPNYFNGKIRVMAVSVGENTMGSTQAVTTVRNDFILNPNIPYFVAPNDEFEISLAVANNLTDIGDKVLPLKVSLTTSPHLAVLDESTKIIELGSMKEGVLKFKLKATEKLGSGDFNFKVSYGDKSAIRKVSTSVRPLSQYRLQTIMGRMNGRSQTFTNLREMYQPFSQRDAAVSFSPFILSKGLSTYLANYPHLCSEQIVSRAIPTLIGRKYPEFDLVKDDQTAMSSLFQTLSNRQNSEGAFGLWYSTYQVNPFITLYTMHFMLEAREANYSVPQKMMHSANQYIKRIASSSGTDLYSLRMRAYAIYLLTRQNEVTTTYIASLMSDLEARKSKDWKTDIVALHLASSYKMLKMDKEAQKLFKPVWNSLSDAYDRAWWTNNYYDPLVVSSEKIYLISKHFPEKVADIPAQALENLVFMLNQGKYTTQSSAKTMLALDSYNQSIINKQLVAEDLTISAADKDKKEHLVATLKGLLAKGQFEENDRSMRFDNKTDLPAWYLLIQQGYDKTYQKEPLKKGLEIYREFSDLNGNPVDHVTLGDTINVTIRLRTLSEEGATNIAIIDLLPGGFEVVQQPLNQNNQKADEEEEEDESEGYYHEQNFRWISPIATGYYTWYPDYTDVREDRVLIYGSTENNHIQTFNYQIKATNVGEYSVPSVFAEAMYDRDIQAMSKGGDKVIVTPR
ncbi:MG2 domain-containing protein [Orbaceae bacterium ac157xtp]